MNSPVANCIDLVKCQNIIRGALLNKYQTLAPSILDMETRLAWKLATNANNENELQALLQPVRNPVDDIRNQVFLLQLIEKFWSRKKCPPQPLSLLHGALFGDMDIKDLRRSEYVTDFGGFAVTPTQEIQSRLDELERMCITCVESLSTAVPIIQASFLAHIFSSLIRVHPFEDGNGRTARMFVLFALRSWKMPIIDIPKVRNDEKWKKALTRAIHGDLSTLQKEILKRM